MRYTNVIVAALVGVAAAGCATLGHGSFKEPIVHFQDARITGAGITGGSVEVRLSVYNPNGFKLDATRLTYKLMIDSTTVGTGALAQPFKVEKNDSSIVTLPVSFSYAGLNAVGRQLMNNGTVNYRVLGDITVGTPLGHFTRPYDQTGRFNTLSGASRTR
jgi:LEA14-like dessication related protein